MFDLLMLPVGVIQSIASHSRDSAVAFRKTCRLMRDEYDSTISFMNMHADDDQDAYVPFLMRNGQFIKTINTHNFLLFPKNLLSVFVGLATIATTCPNLVKLNVNNMGSLVSSLEPLRGLKRLEVLKANRCSFKELEPLVGATSLTNLSISFEYIKAAEVAVVFPKLKKLTVLEICMATREHVDSLYGCNIKYLDIVDADSFDMNRLPCSIERLSVSDGLKWNSCPDLSGIDRLYKLQRFVACVTDLGPMTFMGCGLVELNLGGTFTSLGPLINISTLRVLSCQNSSIKDIEPLVKCKALEQLDISNTLVSDLGPLYTLDRLTLLNVSNTMIKSLNGLDGCTGLLKLDVQTTMITSVAPILALPELHTIFVNKYIQDMKMLTDKVQVNPWRTCGDVRCVFDDE